MQFDDETVSKLLGAVFAGVADEAATEAERGPLLHASPAGYRTYAKQDGGDAVVTLVGPDGVLRSEVVGGDLTDLR